MWAKIEKQKCRTRLLRPSVVFFIFLQKLFYENAQVFKSQVGISRHIPHFCQSVQNAPAASASPNAQT